jgi:hypothetical protein
MWVVSTGRTIHDDLADKEVVHSVAERMAERWPQIPGPPSRYANEAKEAMLKGSFVEAARWSTKALALNPNDAESWILLVVASSQPGFERPILSDTDSVSILNAIEDTSGDSFSLQTAHAWLELRRGGMPEKPVVPDGQFETVESLLLQLQIVGHSARKAVIEDILVIAPGHKLACSTRITIARAEGDKSEEKKWVDRCLEAGVELDVRKSHGETLDSTTASP